MWKGKRLLKKSGAILLALALTVSPLGAVAAEEKPSTETSSSEVVPEGGENLPESGADGTDAEGVGTEDAAEDQNGTATPDGGTVPDQQTPELLIPDQQVPEASEPEEKTEDKTGDGAADAQNQSVFAADGKYDTIQPVIEKIIFDQNGAALTQKDTLKIGVQAYDADSAIASVNVGITFKDADAESIGYGDTITLKQSGSDPKLYEGSYAMEGVVYEGGYVSWIEVIDAAGNTKTESLGQDQYTFKVEPKSLESVTITDLKFSNSGATLKPGEKGEEFSFKVNSGVDLSKGTIYVRFRNADNSTMDFHAWESGEATGEYTGDVFASDWMTPGKWFFDSVIYEEMEKEIPVKAEGSGDVWYEVISKGDQEAPGLVSVEIDKNRQIVKPGETVQFKIKASDDIALQTDYAYLTLAGAAPNISPGYRDVRLEYNSSADTFEGEFAIEETTYPCEWYISDICIWDNAGNKVNNNLWEQEYPYYFQVQNGNTFVNPTYQATISFLALNADGIWEQVQTVTKENVERRTTLKELGIELPEAPQYPGLTFQGWADYNGKEITENTQFVTSGYLTAYAVYDKAPVSISHSYWDESGRRVCETELKMVSKDTLIKDVVSEAVKKEPPVQYPGLTFKEWMFYAPDENQPVGVNFSVQLNAVYDKLLVRFLVNEELVGLDMIYGPTDEETSDIVYSQIVKPGDVVKIPVSSKEYGDYTWLTLTEEEKKAGSITIENYDRAIYGYGSKMNGGGTTPPAEPGTPSAPGGVQLPEESVQQIVNDLNHVAEGDTYQIDMGNATVVPKAVLEAIKGKDINVRLNMGGYSWTINGKDVMASDLKDINLEVKFNTNAVPSETVKKLAGDNPTQQLSLTHEGDFGFKATLTMNAGAEYAGKHGNLFWYDSSHKMVFIDAGVIQENGDVSLTFSHASDYVLVMADTVMSGTGAADPTIQKSVKTGDTTSFFMIFALLVVSAGAAAVILYRRKVK